MARGGHARSGPLPVEGSRTSDRKGYSLTALPAEGFAGDVPELDDFLLAATPRHSEIWAQLWTTPQACAWSLESWRWPVVADLVKWSVRGDADDAASSIATSVRQLRDDLGLSAAGLRANGWKIAAVDAPPVSMPTPTGATVSSIKDRLSRGGA